MRHKRTGRVIMKKQIALFLLMYFALHNIFAENLFTDTWVNWTPRGKIFDIVCFSKKDGDRFYKNVRVLQLNRNTFQYKEADNNEAEAVVGSTKNCYFEQKDTHSVSRDEFFEEIVSVKCTLNQLPFRDGDFRILGTNATTTSVKRLRDGKIWILPTGDCNFTTQLQKKEMVPAGSQNQQQQFQLTGEGSSGDHFNIPPVYSNGMPVVDLNQSSAPKKLQKIDPVLPPSEERKGTTTQSSQGKKSTPISNGIEVETASPERSNSGSSIKSLMQTLGN